MTSPRVLLIVALLSPVLAEGQTLTQRGFIEGQVSLYPQEPASGGDPRQLGQALLRQDVTWRPISWLAFAGGIDARLESNQRVADDWAFDWDDRGAKRPRLTARRASVTLRGRGLSLELGKQLVRWGKADVLNPTDRFAPRDFLDVVDNEVLPITAARLVYERGSETLDIVVQPRVTPSRMPLLSQRWVVLPEIARRIPIEARPTEYPGRAAVGARWNHLGSGYEFSLSVYDGFHHIPRTDVIPLSSRPVLLTARRFLPVTMVGGDLARPTRWVTLRGEAAYYASSEAASDDYAMYVLQAERQLGEWLIVAGYAGEFVTDRGSGRALDPAGETFVAPDRGLARTILGRASWTIDSTRSLALEFAVRRNGKGAYLKSEYSRSFGEHWRLGARAIVLAGEADDFLGQYRRNSSAGLTFRYSY